MDQYQRYLQNGKDIFNTYCSDNRQPPIMLPPAPHQTYIDVYPDENQPGPSFKDDIVQQANFEAEVQVYRALENMYGNFIVLQNFQFTHHQYRLCDKIHDRKGCPKCKGKNAGNNDGECDFLIIGPDYFVVIEVKNMTQNESGIQSDEHSQALLGTFRKSVKQREKITQLIERMGSNVNIFGFTAYPNFSRKYKDQFQLTCDEKEQILFKEDVHTKDGCNRIDTWWKRNGIQPVCYSSEVSPYRCNPPQKHYEIRNMFLAIWCTDKDDCDKEKCSFGKCIKDIDDKLRCGKFAFRKNNPNVVPAPDIMRDCLGIENLTKKQHYVFTSNKNFMWIDGPAGAGKSILLIAKIIELIKSGKSSKVLLFNFLFETSHPDEEQKPKLYETPLDNAGVSYKVLFLSENILFTEDLEMITRALVDNQVVIVNGRAKRKPRFGYLNEFFSELLRSLQESCDIFIDDFQCVLVEMGTTTHSKRKPQTWIKDFSDMMTSLSQLSSSYHVWLSCDIIQMFSLSKSNFNFMENKTSSLLAFNKLLSDHDCVSTVDANLRNTYDISYSLSVIREYILKELLSEAISDGNKYSPGISRYRPRVTIDGLSVFAKLLSGMDQKEGHYIYGPKPRLHPFGKPLEDHILAQYLRRCIDRLKREMGVRPMIICEHSYSETYSYGLEVPGTLPYPLGLLHEETPSYKWCFQRTVSSAEWPAILLYIKRDDICIYICYHFTDTTASTLTRRYAKTVKDMKLKLF